MVQKGRKEKEEVLFPLMDKFLRAGPTGIVANSQFARLNGWLPETMHALLTKLKKKGILICTEAGQDKRITIAGDLLRSHKDWMLLYYNGEIPPRYRDVASSEEMSPLVQNTDDQLPERIEQILREKNQLKSENIALEQKVLELQEENRKLTQILENELVALRKAFSLLRNIKL